jgi:hypothetical protein
MALPNADGHTKYMASLTSSLQTGSGRMNGLRLPRAFLVFSEEFSLCCLMQRCQQNDNKYNFIDLTLKAPHGAE